jgi:predicted nucleotidyltransferase
MDFSDDIKRIIEYFRGREEVSALYIFGSTAKGKGTEESDIDVAVLINDRKKGKRPFESLRKTYYAFSPKLSCRPLDIVILNIAPPFLKHRIFKTGELLFDKNRRLRVRFKADALIEYFDYKPIEDICLRAVAGRFRRVAVGR